MLKLTHREHAVPLKVLVGNLYMFDNVNTLELQQFLNHNLVSVLITKSEQKLLDTPKYNVKDKMPENWNGQDIFARFKMLEIKLIKRF